MPGLDKKSLSERDICTKLIMTALIATKGDVMRRIRAEISFTKGGVNDMSGALTRLTASPERDRARSQQHPHT